MNYDNRTIGRFPPRTTASGLGASGSSNDPLFMFFDGKSFNPINSRGADMYTGYGMTGLTLRPTKLQQTDFDYARAYALCEYAFRCVEMVASDVAAIKHGVRDKNTQEPIDNHPLTQALAWARRNLYQDVLSLWQKALYIFGECYLLPVPNGFTTNTGRNVYGGLQWLNPLAVEPVVLGGRLQGYDYNGSSSFRRFAPDEIIFDKVTSIFDDMRGQSRLSVALHAVNIDAEIKRYTLDSFLKDMRMSGILTGRANSGITESDLNAAVAKLKEQRDSRLVALAAPLEYQQVQHKFTDTQFQASDDARRRITTALGVPMSVVGAWDDAHYQSAPAQIAWYYDHVIFRECDRLTLFINDVILPYFDPSGAAEWYFDRESVAALAEDQATKIATYNARLNAGGMTLNEYRQALGEKPVPNGDVYYIPSGVVITPAAQLGTMPLAPEVPALAAVTPTPAQPEAVAALETGKSACLMLKIGAHPDLIGLQQRVKRLCEDKAIPIASWNAPDEFHITLAYAPTASDEQIAALSAVLPELEWDEDMTIKLGRLQAFDNVGEYPIVFRVSKTADITELQESAYELFTASGIAVSGHHQPARYIPHITMAYAAQSIGKPILYRSLTRIEPSAVELWHGDELIYSRPFQQPEAPPPEPEQPPPAPVEPDEQDATKSAPVDFITAALDELSAWRKKVRNTGAYKAGSFKTYLIRDEIAANVYAALSTGNDELIADAFKTARELISTKSIQATRLLFEDAFETLLADALAGSITRRQFSGRLRSLLELNIYRAYVDGLRDGGVDDDPSEDEQKEINALIADQGQYISGLADAIYKDEDTIISSAVAEQKPAMWFNKSVNPAYLAGLAAADGNSLYEWVYGNTEESCADCQKLNGQRHRMKDWTRKGLLPKVDTLECKGFNCKCTLVKASGKARGNWL